MAKKTKEYTSKDYYATKFTLTSLYTNRVMEMTLGELVNWLNIDAENIIVYYLHNKYRILDEWQLKLAKGQTKSRIKKRGA